MDGALMALALKVTISVCSSSPVPFHVSFPVPSPHPHLPGEASATSHTAGFCGLFPFRLLAGAVTQQAQPSPISTEGGVGSFLLLHLLA